LIVLDREARLPIGGVTVPSRDLSSSGRGPVEWGETER